MIIHVWSVICQRSVIDKDSLNISLFDVLEQLNLAGTLPEDKNKQIIIPIRFELVSLWAREQYDKPVRGMAKLSTSYPSGDIIEGPQINIDLTVHPRTRSRIVFNGLPFKESGRHVFLIQIRKGDKWKEVARLPIEILYKSTPE